MNPITGSIVSNLGGAIIGGIGQMITNHQNIAAQQAINKQQLDFAREQTDREFDYNSISSQMKRAMEAGVNPYLLAGANPTSANAQSTPSIDAPVRSNPFASVPQNAMNIGNNLIAAEQLDLRDKEIQVQKQANDIQAFNQKIQLFKTVLDTLGTKDLTSSEIQGIMTEIFTKDANNVTLPEVIRDNYVTTEINNKIEASNIGIKDKRFLHSWLKSFTMVQYQILRKEVDVMKSQERLNNYMSAVNSAKVREINQAIENMQEEWKSLNFQGELDQAKLSRITEMANSIIDKLVSEAKVSRTDAEYWLWKFLVQNQSTLKIGPGGLQINNTMSLPDGTFYTPGADSKF